MLRRVNKLLKKGVLKNIKKNFFVNLFVVVFLRIFSLFNNSEIMFGRSLELRCLCASCICCLRIIVCSDRCRGLAGTAKG